MLEGCIAADDGANIMDRVRLGEGCIVAKKAVVGPDVSLGPGCYVDDFAKL